MDTGAGWDTLDYSQYSYTVLASWSTNRATGVGSSSLGTAGATTGFEAVIGSGTTNQRVEGPDAVNQWRITGENTGTINAGQYSFTDIPYLLGGPQEDVFHVENGGSLSYFIIGSSSDRIELADRDAPIDVNVSSRNIPGVLGGFFAGELLIEGAQDNRLLGSTGTVTLTLNTDGTVNGNNVHYSAGFAQFVGGSSGTESLYAPELATDWHITGDDTGYLLFDGRRFDFTATEDLVGSNAVDSFTVEVGGNWNGRLLGQGGDDTFNILDGIVERTDGGTGNDIFTLSGGSVNQVSGSSGNDTLIGPDTDSLWTIDGRNQGTLNTSTSFSYVESLVGGSGDDTFRFTGGFLDYIDGTLDTGAGWDTLDYSQYFVSYSVFVSWSANRASGVGYGAALGATTGFEAVVGSGAPSQTVVGPDAVNQWTISGENTGTINNGQYSFTNIARLQGGPQEDVFLIQSGGSYDGSLIGNGGIDRLELAARSEPLEVSVNSRSILGVLGSYSLEKVVALPPVGNRLLGSEANTNWQVTANGEILVSSVTYTGFDSILGGTGDDTLFVDYTGGNLDAVLQIAFDGGPGGNDGLGFTGGSFNTVSYDPTQGTLQLGDVTLNLSTGNLINLSNTAIANLIVSIDQANLVAAEIVTTVTATNATDTLISFSESLGGIVVRNVSGRLTILGDAVDSDTIALAGLGSSLAADIIVDGLGGIDQVRFNDSFMLRTNADLEVLAEQIATAADAVVRTQGTGRVLLFGDEIDLALTSTIDSANSVTVAPLSSDRDIELGTASASALSLTASMLERILTPLLIIGRDQMPSGTPYQGVITVSGDVTLVANTNLQLRTAADIILASTIDTSGGTLSLNPGDAPHAVQVALSPSAVIASELSIAAGSDLRFTINGTTAGSEYSQLNLTAALDLTAVNLVIDGQHQPSLAESFLLINKDGTDAISGNLVALPEGSVINNFLESPVSAQVSYLGQDAASGNDFVLTVIEPPNSPPVADAGGPYTINEGDSLTLDASGSIDLDGDTLAYSWDVNGDSVFGDATGVMPTLTREALDALGVNNEDNFNVTLLVDDGNGNFQTDSTTLTVQNVAPTFDAAGVGVDATLDKAVEGIFSRTGIPFNDPGILDAHTVEVDWDGDLVTDQSFNVSPVGTRTFDLNHTFLSIGTFTVTVTLKDELGSVSDSFDVTVDLNLPPTANAGGPYSVDEGGSVVLSAVASSDPDQAMETLDYQWDLDGDGIFGETGSNAGRGDEIGITPTFSALGLNGPGTFTAMLRVTDDAGLTGTGLTGTDSATITIDNVAPVIEPIDAVTINQGDMLSIAGQFNDPGLDDWTATVNYADGSGNQSLTLVGKTFQLSHVYSTAGTYMPVVTIDDGNGSTQTAVTTLTVQNVAPTFDVAGVGADATLDKAVEGIFSRTGIPFNDPGILDAHTVEIDWDGDLVVDQSFSVSPSGARAFDLNHTFLSIGTFTVTVTLKDELDSVSDRFDVTVDLNLPPTANAGGTYNVDEGGSVDLSAAASSDPDQAMETLDYQWDLDGDNIFGETGSNAGRGDEIGITPTFSALGLNGPGTFTAMLRVTNDAGMTATDSATITIDNVAPVIDPIDAVMINQGDTLSIAGEFIDPGPDAWTATVNYADGSGDQPLTLVGKTFQLNHVYITAGSYSPVVTIDDGNGSTQTAVTTLTVQNVAPTFDAAGVGVDATLDKAVEGVFSRTGIPFNDPGILDAHTVEIDWDGDLVVDQSFNVAPSGSRTFDLNHTFLSVGTFTVTVTLKDEFGSVSDSFDVTVDLNLPPTANAGGTYNVDEGGSVGLSAAGSSDPDQAMETLDYQWDLDGDNIFGETGSDAGRGDEIGITPTFSALGLSGPSTFTAMLRVTDDAGLTGTDSATITIDNVAPVIVPIDAVTINQGDTLSIAGQFIDPGPDTWTATVNYADGSGNQPLTLVGKTFQLSHVYSTAGTYMPVVTIDDGNGSTQTAVTTLTVQNVAPTFDAAGVGVDATLDKAVEGAFSRTGIQFNDPGTLDVHTVEIDWNGDSVVDQSFNVAPSGSRTFDLNHTFLSVGTFTVTVTLKDEFGSVSDSFDVTVDLNLPPTANAGGPYSVDEGSTVSLDATGTSDDQGIANVMITWDLDGDNVFGETGVDATRGDETGLEPVFSAEGLDGPQSITVRLRVEDEQGRVDNDTTTVSIQNVAPAIEFTASSTAVVRGEAFTLDGSFVDPGPDTWTATVNYADGSGEQPLTLIGKSFQLSHVYSTAGAYTAVVTIDDGSGGVSENVTVIVELPPLADLTLISADVSFSPINPGVGDAVNFVVDVTNKGALAASNVPVSVQVYDAASESFVEIGRPTIASIDADAEGQVTLTWDGAGGQPALPSEDAYLLVRVVVDPDSTIEESDESNNGASQVLQVGSPDFGSAALVADVPEFMAHQGEFVAVGGRAFYDFTTVPGSNDFPVQNASVTVRLTDQAGQVLRAAGGRTAINGNFIDTFRAPEADGVYTLRFEISDGTLSSVFETILTVEGESPVPPPPRPRGPAGPGYVFSPSIEFTLPALPPVDPQPGDPKNPQIGEPVTIIGSFRYDLAQPLLDVPVTFNDLFPVAGQLQTFEIGSGFVSFPDGGLAEPAVLPMTWTPTAEGYHIVQVIAQPDFNFRAHTHATRLVLVGDLDTTSLSVEYDAEIVPDPMPAFAAARGFSAPLAMAAGQAPAPGDTLSFTLRYENTGTTTITGGMLIDDFDETLLGLPTNISDGGTADGNIIRWELGDIAPGTFGTVTYEVTINSNADFPPGAAYLFNTAILNADQAVAANTSELIVSNNAPVITGLNVDEMLDENGDVTLTATFSDASTADTHTVVIEWGDGQTDTLTFTAGERSYSIGHSYRLTHPPLVTSYPINVSVTDANGQSVSDAVATQVPVTDQTSPSSSVLNAIVASSGEYDIEVGYVDASGANEASISGVTWVDVFYRVNPQGSASPAQLLGRIPLAPPSADGTATLSSALNAAPGDVIQLWSVATDAAGNVENEVTPRTDYSFVIADTVGPETQVDSAVFDESAFIDLQVSGADVGGGNVDSIDVYVETNPGTEGSEITLVGTVGGGANTVSGTLQFPVPQDGVTRSYRFFSIGTDHLGNREGGSGTLDGDPGAGGDVLLADIMLSAPASGQIIGFDANGGLDNRSSVYSVDVLFNDEGFIDDLLDSLNDGDTTNDRIRLERLDLAGNSIGTGEFLQVPMVRDGLTLRLDFGAAGLQENGVYAVRVDMDGDTSNGFEDVRRFHRLLGDINGDGLVNTADLRKARLAYRNPALHSDADVDGDGDVDRYDLRFFSTFLRQTGVEKELLMLRDDLDD